jgi:broad specificity phosphatase PhoE
MILLARHGETEWNVERRMQGRKDSPLTEKGRRQAHAMAALLRDLTARETGPWRLVSSPLGRARATAEVIAAATRLTLETDERLIEVGCGPWEGRLWAEVEADPALADAPRDWLFDRLGGDRHVDMLARLQSFLDSLEPEPERRAVLVSHGVAGLVLRSAYRGLAGVPPWEPTPQDAVYRLQNGQIDRFDCEPVD